MGSVELVYEALQAIGVVDIGSCAVAQSLHDWDDVVPEAKESKDDTCGES